MVKTQKIIPKSHQPSPVRKTKLVEASKADKKVNKADKNSQKGRGFEKINKASPEKRKMS
jgi:hypothetical protein